jgi:hypothetical protein
MNLKDLLNQSILGETLQNMQESLHNELRIAYPESNYLSFKDLSLSPELGSFKLN